MVVVTKERVGGARSTTTICGKKTLVLVLSRKVALRIRLIARKEELVLHDINNLHKYIHVYDDVTDTSLRTFTTAAYVQ